MHSKCTFRSKFIRYKTCLTFWKPVKKSFGQKVVQKVTVDDLDLAYLTNTYFNLHLQPRYLLITVYLYTYLLRHTRMYFHKPIFLYLTGFLSTSTYLCTFTNPFYYIYLDTSLLRRTCVLLQIYFTRSIWIPFYFDKRLCFYKPIYLDLSICVTINFKPMYFYVPIYLFLSICIPIYFYIPMYFYVSSIFYSFHQIT